jgi:hypothetical protein
MLRTIDAEEFSQRRAEPGGFEAGCAAYRRREFSQAATIFRSIDKKMLDDSQRSRLAQINMTPEMQPQNIVTQVADVKPGVTGSQPMTPNRTGPSAPDFGRASVSDSDPQKDLLKQTEAMQDIKFQQLRSDSHNAMRDAADRSSPATPTARSSAAELPRQARRRAARQRPRRVCSAVPWTRVSCSSRRQGGATFEQNTLRARQNVNHAGRSAAVQDNKEKKVKELMDQHRSFYKDGSTRRPRCTPWRRTISTRTTLAAAAKMSPSAQQTVPEGQGGGERCSWTPWIRLRTSASTWTAQPVVLDPEHTRASLATASSTASRSQSAPRAKDREIESSSTRR